MKLIRLIRFDESKILFMDDSGFNISIRSIYGRSPRNTKPTKIVKYIRSKNISMLCCINKDQMIHCDLLDRAYYRENNGIEEGFSKIKADATRSEPKNSEEPINAQNSSYTLGKSLNSWDLTTI
ncbi:hypothetical protein RF11_08227 [Thelohanellus kitauei]|uniref:Tc1-like transposase DDE domain-containing protein n=1 Tax=Thelohanellus kitauei TaxID=669202 RepID=A0A0C2NBX0_THEKT|nr:hypothetical protein RF11_08227 [Thelohanellus kitauei]